MPTPGISACCGYTAASQGEARRGKLHFGLRQLKKAPLRVQCSAGASAARLEASASTVRSALALSLCTPLLNTWGKPLPAFQAGLRPQWLCSSAKDPLQQACEQLTVRASTPEEGVLDTRPFQKTL